MFKNNNGFKNNQEAQVPSPRAADPVGPPSLISAACHSSPPTGLEAKLGEGVFQMPVAPLGGPRR